jgi:hypothetical protein
MTCHPLNTGEDGRNRPDEGLEESKPYSMAHTDFHDLSVDQDDLGGLSDIETRVIVASELSEIDLLNEEIHDDINDNKFPADSSLAQEDVNLRQEIPVPGTINRFTTSESQFEVLFLFRFISNFIPALFYFPLYS